MKLAVEVKGAKELRRAAKQAGKDVQKELRTAHKDVARIVSEDSRKEAPRLTGRLQSSIRPSGTMRAAAVRAGTAKVPYAAVIHFGWAKRNIRPNPFIYRSLQEKWDAVVEAYEKQVRKLADLIATRRS